ncbi:hypothetical protein LV92_04025 [Arenibacter echinorum]|uniref:Uncharacterized protein n=1 Tax=Arenibacter echinorum TaxID=440515 RepID=A0A327QUP1_9FLAO|nr:hypothetical protein LV92_04025 [Arenibacter echinorum]
MKIRVISIISRIIMPAWPMSLIIFRKINYVLQEEITKMKQEFKIIKQFYLLQLKYK